MPNKKQHQETGGIVGLVYGLFNSLIRQEKRQKETGEPFDFLELLAETGAGYIGGRLGATLPDVFEPATNPNHRGSLHSVSMGAITTTGAVTLHKNEQVNPILRTALVSAKIGYVSHLVEDSQTPKGIKWI